MERNNGAAQPLSDAGRRKFLRKFCATAGSLTIVSSFRSSHALERKADGLASADAWQTVAPPVQAVTPVTRPNIRSLTPGSTQLAKLKEAFQIVRSRVADDPTGIAVWANIHGQHCDLGDPENDIHNNWWFLPWHRAYLYFFEKILQKAVSDDTLAIPYWRWPEDLSMPSQCFIDGESNPLYYANRGKGVADRLPSDIVGEVTNLLDIPDFERFGGTRTVMGTAMCGPHARVHYWVGKDWINLSKSGLDPLFYMHHANVDRLWQKWLRDPSHKNPSNSQWLIQPYTFYDASGTAVSVTMEDTLAMSSYDDDGIAQTLVGPDTRVTLESVPTTVNTVRPSGNIHKSYRKRIPDKKKQRVIVHIKEIELPTDSPVIVRVFVNLPSATAKTSLKSPYYGGLFTLLPAREHTTEHSANFMMDITDQISINVMPTSPASVTLVPVDIDSKPAQKGKIAFKTLYLEFID